MFFISKVNTRPGGVEVRSVKDIEIGSPPNGWSADCLTFKFDIKNVTFV